MLDTHCHIDLNENPLALANDCEKRGIITIGMTNLPSHFEMGFPHLIGFKKVRLALGMHPLYAEEHEKEFPIFLRNLSKTSYIGEVGLDFSLEGFKTKNLQMQSFTKILEAIGDKKKLLSLHSRRAENEILEQLIKYNIKAAIFHWYSGSLKLIEKIIENGYYFSINPAMIISKSGQEIIKKLPLDRILTESDSPFITQQGRIIQPNDISLVQNYLATERNIPSVTMEKIISNNFSNVLKFLK